jgi:hypothetical protein
MSYQPVVSGQMNPIPLMPPVVSIPQPFGALPNSKGFYVESPPKGWNFVNILLILLVVCSCLTSITNLLNGQVGGAVCTMCCMVIFYCIYASYNNVGPVMVLPVQPTA